MTPARHPRAFTLWAGPLDGMLREIRPTGSGEWAPVRYPVRFDNLVDPTVTLSEVDANVAGTIAAVYRYVPDRDRYEYEPPAVV